LARQEFRQRIIGSHDLFVEVRGLWILKWEVTADHSVEDDPTAPYISSESMVSLTSNHLRGCVARGSTGCLKRSSLLIHVTETEIDDLEGEIVIKEEILRLKISMADSTLVDVLDT